MRAWVTTLAGVIAGAVSADAALGQWTFVTLQLPQVYQDGILPYPDGNGNWNPPPGEYGDYGPYGEGALGGYDAGVPLEEEVYEPAPTQAWFSFEEWDASFEAGLNGSEGNSDTLSLTTGFDFSRESELSESSIVFRYATTHTNQVETQNNALLKLQHEWLFPDSPWSAFVNNDLLYDRFKAFDLRLVMNGGVGYTHIKTDRTTFKSRYGAGVSREFGGPDNSWRPEALFGLDFTRQITDRQKLNAVFDYYPEWTDLNDYRFVADFSWELLVDAEANLSLKLSVTDQYDSTPNGAEPNDIFYAFLLLWKL